MKTADATIENAAPHWTSRVARATFVVAALSVTTAYAANVARPNILLIFADDLGWKDVGRQGAGFCETPRIDALACQGMIFSDAYASAGNCQPSRACLISGQYTPRHHVFAVNSTRRGPVEWMRLIPVPNRSGIAPTEISVADVLRSARYATGIFGKWHLGGPEGALPSEQGFETVVDLAPSGQGVSEDPKRVFALTDAACTFMEESVKGKRPFFCYVPHYAIHTGHQARQATLDYFREKARSTGSKLALYAACVKELDTGVGMLLDKLDSLGVAEQTLVVFTSDNGGTQQSPQEPLRGNKGCYYEGGIREPFIVRWPGVVAPGSNCATPVIQVDLFPTFVAAAGASLTRDKILDGEDLRPLLEQTGKWRRKSIYWHFPGYLNDPVIRGRDPVFRTRPVSVVRQGDWKLHLYHEEWLLDGGRDCLATNRAVELYNLRDDVGERSDLAQQQIARRDLLLDDLLAWCRAIAAPFPQTAP